MEKMNSVSDAAEMPPTEAQIKEILTLAASVGMRIRLSSIESRAQAHRIILALTTIGRHMLRRRTSSRIRKV